VTTERKQATVAVFVFLHVEQCQIEMGLFLTMPKCILNVDCKKNGTYF